MDSSSLFDSMLVVGSKIDNLWSMYIVVHLGLFWFFFLIHRPLLMIERLIALFAYTFFAYINGNALTTSYRLLEAIRIDLADNFRHAFGGAPAVYDMIATKGYADRGEMILATHAGAWLLVMLFLAFRNRFLSLHGRYYPQYRPAPEGS